VAAARRENDEDELGACRLYQLWDWLVYQFCSHHAERGVRDVHCTTVTATDVSTAATATNVPTTAAISSPSPFHWSLLTKSVVRLQDGGVDCDMSWATHVLVPGLFLRMGSGQSSRLVVGSC